LDSCGLISSVKNLFEEILDLQVDQHKTCETFFTLDAWGLISSVKNLFEETAFLLCWCRSFSDLELVWKIYWIIVVTLELWNKRLLLNRNPIKQGRNKV
jgi:hypothetical protein